MGLISSIGLSLSKVQSREEEEEGGVKENKKPCFLEPSFTFSHLHAFAPSFFLMRFIPVLSHTHIDPDRDRKCEYSFHFFFDQRLHLVDLLVRHFEDQFIVHLKDHPRSEVAPVRVASGY